jgi:hypothetical protein
MKKEAFFSGADCGRIEGGRVMCACGRSDPLSATAAAQPAYTLDVLTRLQGARGWFKDAATRAVLTETIHGIATDTPSPVD